MVSPVFHTLTLVATNSADKFTGGSQIEEFVKLDGELVEVIDPATGVILAGSPLSDTPGTASFNEVFDNITVDYSHSTAGVRIDLAAPTQHGGFAEGDTLVNVYSIIGSSFNDVIRGSDEDQFPGGHSRIPALIRSLAAGATTFSKAVAASIPVTASSKTLTGDPAGTRRAMSPRRPPSP